jgi:predicted RNA binding protein YcfA (HicA-like mRNA interferase family)
LVTSRELLRRLRRLGVEVVSTRGKGGHVMVRREDRVSIVPTGSGEVPTGTLHAILRQLDLQRDQL